MVLVYNQNIRAITEARDQVRLVVRNAIAKATTEISICGSELAEHIYPEVTQDQSECAAERAQNRLEEIHRQLIQETEDQASEILPMLNKRLEDLEGSSRYQETFRNIHRRMEGHDWSGAFHRVASVAKTLSDLSQKLAFNSAKVSQGASGMARFSGSIGHRLGHSFRPWEAVRLTSYIGRAAPFLSIAGPALTVGAQLDAERREDKKSQEPPKDTAGYSGGIRDYQRKYREYIQWRVGRSHQGNVGRPSGTVDPAPGGAKRSPPGTEPTSATAQRGQYGSQCADPPHPYDIGATLVIARSAATRESRKA